MSIQTDYTFTGIFEVPEDEQVIDELQFNAHLQQALLIPALPAVANPQKFIAEVLPPPVKNPTIVLDGKLHSLAAGAGLSLAANAMLAAATQSLVETAVGRTTKTARRCRTKLCASKCLSILGVALSEVENVMKFRALETAPLESRHIKKFKSRTDVY